MFKFKKSEIKPQHVSVKLKSNITLKIDAIVIKKDKNSLLIICSALYGYIIPFKNIKDYQITEIKELGDKE